MSECVGGSVYVYAVVNKRSLTQLYFIYCTVIADV